MSAAAASVLTLYDGRILIGNVTGADKEWLAFDARGNPIPGTYASAKAAASAINSSFASSCVADTSGRLDGSG